ncbi:MAG: SdrD B-like domain-containing protein, partial [Vicinamibacterales bacterium]
MDSSAHSGHAWRRALLGFLIAFCTGSCLVAGSLALPANAQADDFQISRDINTYVLFALYDLSFKGEQTTTSDNILDGNVGVNYPNGELNNRELSFGGPTKLSDSTQVVANRATIGDPYPDSKVWELYTNEVSNSMDPNVIRHPNPATVNTSLKGATPLDDPSGPIDNRLPIVATQNLPQFPVMPVLPCPSGSVEVNTSNSSAVNPYVLDPGIYCDVVVRDGAWIKLKTGNYYVRSFDGHPNIHVLTEDGTWVLATGLLDVGDGSTVGPADGAKFWGRSDGISPSDPSMSFGRNTTFHGQVYLPNGHLALGHNGDLFGRFWARTIASDLNTVLHLRGAAKKSGMKFEDLDGDGHKDAGEPGLPGWQIFVDYNGNGVYDDGNGSAAKEPSAVTAADGTYTISPINPGTYDVREVQQEGWTCSYPTAEPNCYYKNELFQSDTTNTGNDFGNYRKGSISGTKFEDLDADGAAREQGEPAIAGITIYLDGSNGNPADGTKQAGETATTTDQNGNFSFTNLTPGNYVVREELTGGYVCSYPASGAGCKYDVTLASNQVATGKDFGNWKEATKVGHKFNDLNANGQEDQGEPRLAGWTIYIDADGSNTLNNNEPSTTTDQNGDFKFEGLKPGTYTFREVQQTNWHCSTPGNNAGDEDDCEHTDTLTSGQTSDPNVFGNWKEAGISGTKFEDLDSDGAAREPGEPAIAGITIYLDGSNGNPADGTRQGGETSTTTDVNGNFSFTNLAPGNYTVREDPSGGYICSFPASGSGCKYDVTLASGGSSTGNNFGNWRAATKVGHKFNDLNANGQEDQGEPRLAG